MTRVHVLVRKEDLDRERLAGKVVVVVDVLFATSTIVAALAHGATEVVPALDGEAARAEAARRPAGSCLLAGERDAVTLPGFAHPTPLAVVEGGVAGKALVYSTTNGTVALRKAAGAARVYAGALLNGEAVVERVASLGGSDTVLLVCAGSAEAMNLEDFHGVGYLASLLARRDGFELSDAALAARLLAERTDAHEVLSAGRIGRLMRARGLEREVAFAARRSAYAAVPELRGGVLTA